MSGFKKVLHWLKNPRIWFLIIFYFVTAAAIAGAITVMVLGPADSPIAYILFALAAITLGYSVYSIARFAPKIKRKLMDKLKQNEFTGKIVQNYGFRTILFAILSFAISIAYAAFNGVFAIISRSIWYGALSGYYILLAFMRGGVLFYHKKEKNRVGDEEDVSVKKVREIKTYRTCGILLIVLPLALSAAILQMVTSEKAFEHSGYMIYVAASYTFYKIIMSIINFVKAGKGEQMTVQAIRNINLADAMVSILALQTAMFREFSTGSNSAHMNAITGAGVCALTVALGVFMLINAGLKLRKAKKEKLR